MGMNAYQIGGKRGGLVTASRYDACAMTARARDGFMARFYRQVDPDGVLGVVERERRAQAALRAHMAGLAIAKRRKRLRLVK